MAYLLYLAGGCIIFESIEEAAESEQTKNIHFKQNIFKAMLFDAKSIYSELADAF